MKGTSPKNIGFAVAAAAAALLASGCSSLCSEAESAPVKCAGLNACKGSSSCATPQSACKGHNSCKGQGWVHMSQEQCLARGGHVVHK